MSETDANNHQNFQRPPPIIIPQYTLSPQLRSQQPQQNLQQMQAQPHFQQVNVMHSINEATSPGPYIPVIPAQLATTITPEVTSSIIPAISPPHFTHQQPTIAAASVAAPMLSPSIAFPVSASSSSFSKNVTLTPIMLTMQAQDSINISSFQLHQQLPPPSLTPNNISVEIGSTALMPSMATTVLGLQPSSPASLGPTSVSSSAEASLSPIGNQFQSMLHSASCDPPIIKKHKRGVSKTTSNLKTNNRISLSNFPAGKRTIFDVIEVEPFRVGLLMSAGRAAKKVERKEGVGLIAKPGEEISILKAFTDGDPLEKVWIYVACRGLFSLPRADLANIFDPSSIHDSMQSFDVCRIGRSRRNPQKHGTRPKPGMEMAECFCLTFPNDPKPLWVERSLVTQLDTASVEFRPTSIFKKFGLLDNSVRPSSLFPHSPGEESNDNNNSSNNNNNSSETMTTSITPSLTLSGAASSSSSSLALSSSASSSSSSVSKTSPVSQQPSTGFMSPPPSTTPNAVTTTTSAAKVSLSTLQSSIPQLTSPILSASSASSSLQKLTPQAALGAKGSKAKAKSQAGVLPQQGTQTHQVVQPVLHHQKPHATTATPTATPTTAPLTAPSSMMVPSAPNFKGLFQPQQPSQQSQNGATLNTHHKHKTPSCISSSSSAATINEQDESSPISDPLPLMPTPKLSGSVTSSSSTLAATNDSSTTTASTSLTPIVAATKVNETSLPSITHCPEPKENFSVTRPRKKRQYNKQNKVKANSNSAITAIISPTCGPAPPPPINGKMCIRSPTIGASYYNPGGINMQQRQQYSLFVPWAPTILDSGESINRSSSSDPSLERLLAYSPFNNVSSSESSPSAAIWYGKPPEPTGQARLFAVQPPSYPLKQSGDNGVNSNNNGDSGSGNQSDQSGGEIASVVYYAYGLPYAIDNSDVHQQLQQQLPDQEEYQKQYTKSQRSKNSAKGTNKHTGMFSNLSGMCIDGDDDDNNDGNGKNAIVHHKLLIPSEIHYQHPLYREGNPNQPQAFYEGAADGIEINCDSNVDSLYYHLNEFQYAAQPQQQQHGSLEDQQVELQLRQQFQDLHINNIYNDGFVPTYQQQVQGLHQQQKQQLQFIQQQYQTQAQQSYQGPQYKVGGVSQNMEPCELRYDYPTVGNSGGNCNNGYDERGNNGNYSVDEANLRGNYFDYGVCNNSGSSGSSGESGVLCVPNNVQDEINIRLDLGYDDLGNHSNNGDKWDNFRIDDGIHDADGNRSFSENSNDDFGEN